MLHIAVVDDDIRVIAEITALLQKYYKNTDYEQDDFNNGLEFIRSIKFRERYDIVFMDIEMKGANGEEAVRELRKEDVDEKTYVIYVSSHTDNLTGLFSLHPFDFIEKPFSEERFLGILQKISKSSQDKRLTISIVVNRKTIEICLADIKYVQSEGHKLIIYVKDQQEPLISYMKIETFFNSAREVSMDFIRTHASFVINRCYVKRYMKNNVVIDNIEIPVSSKYRNRMLMDIRNGV